MENKQKVKNIKVTEFNLIDELSNKKNERMQKCLSLLDDMSLEEIKDILPKKSKITVEFELVNANTSLANAIRRCLVDELEIYSFDFNEYNDLVSDDPYILCDFIKKQIDLLPINQGINYDGVVFELHKVNDTDEIIEIMSKDISIVTKDTKINIQDVVGQNILLGKLRPNNFIKINNITVSKGTAKHNAAKYNTVSNIKYKIYDVNPIVETKTGKTGVSSLLSNPTHFYIGYTTHRNIDNPKLLMVNCCDILISRLNKIYEEMQNIKDDTASYISQLLILETSGDMKKLQIVCEYWTIINIISQYVYIITKKNIKFIAPALIHPEKEIGVIKIIHPEFSTVIKNSIKQITKDLQQIKEAFIK